MRNVATTTQRFHFFPAAVRDAIISPPWLGCSSLERWKSIIDFIVQRIAMVGLICEQGGGDNDTDTVISGGGLLV